MVSAPQTSIAIIGGGIGGLKLDPAVKIVAKKDQPPSNVTPLRPV